VNPTGATVASLFVDPLGNRHVGSTIFRNSLGGKVAVTCASSDHSNGLFGSCARMRWVHGILRWMGTASLPIVPSLTQDGFSTVFKMDEGFLLCFAHLGMDPLSQLDLRLHKSVWKGEMLILTPEGAWEMVEAAATPGETSTEEILHVPCNLQALSTLALRIK
jgi:hypothetical protein